METPQAASSKPGDPTGAIVLLVLGVLVLGGIGLWTTAGGLNFALRGQLAKAKDLAAFGAWFLPFTSALFLGVVQFGAGTARPSLRRLGIAAILLLGSILVLAVLMRWNVVHCC